MERIGIVAALACEAAALTRAARADAPVAVDSRFSIVLCGSGAERARLGAERLLDAGADALMSFGVAGALSCSVRPGELLIARTVLGADRDWSADAGWRERVESELGGAPLRMHVGTIFSSGRMVARVPDKIELHRATGAEAVDMESAAIFDVADRRGVPALALRAILDPAELELPAAIVRRSDAYGRVPLLPLLADLALRPLDVPRVVALAHAYRAATSTLRWLGRHRERVLAARAGS